MFQPLQSNWITSASKYCINTDKEVLSIMGWLQSPFDLNILSLLLLLLLQRVGKAFLLNCGFGSQLHKKQPVERSQTKESIIYLKMYELIIRFE